MALDEWVNEGIEPPASRVPRLADRTLVTLEKLIFPAIPNVQHPQRMNRIGVLDDWIEPVFKTDADYQALVCQTDADGNDTAGIRLPPIAAPIAIATYTGWNLYKTPYPEGELCDRDGSYLPFAATKAEREAQGDARASLEERYGNHADYVKQVEKAAADLVSERLLLPEDAERYVNEAKCDNPLQRGQLDATSPV